MDYTRHAIELDKRSDAEIAASFNTEISRAVRYEANRSEAARKIVAMHKRHGKAVTSVLEIKIAENAPGLVDGTLDDSCLVALLLGRKYVNQGALTTRAGAAPFGASDSIATAPALDSPSTTLSRVEQMLETFLAKFDGRASKPRSRKKRRLGKRDTVIFAAIVMGLTGMKYSTFLDKHGLRTKWADSGPGSYSASYRLGEPWRKRVQEKTRARGRMRECSEPEIADAINCYLPQEFDGIVDLLHSQDSRRASKTPKRLSIDKHSQFADSHSS